MSVLRYSSRSLWKTKDFISDGKTNVFWVKDFAFCMHIESIYCDYKPTNH